MCTALFQKDAIIAHLETDMASLKSQVEQLTRQFHTSEQELEKLRQLNTGSMCKATVAKLLKMESFGQLVFNLSVAQKGVGAHNCLKKLH